MDKGFVNLYLVLQAGYVYVKQIEKTCWKGCIKLIGGYLKLIKIVLISSIIFLQLTSCKDSGTEPNQKQFKDQREMTWTVDTLPVPEGAIQVLPKDLLVVSLTDVWLATWVGHGQIMRYDSKTWKMVKEIGGGINSLVQGNSNDIWAGGYSNTIYLGHYDGVSWTRADDMGITGEILDMSKDPSGNIWAVGRNGVVLKYSQGKWIADTIKVNHYSDASYSLYSITSFGNKMYTLAAILDSKRKRDVYYFINGEINNWTVIDSMVLDFRSSIVKWGTHRSYSSSFGKLYSFGSLGLWEYEGNNWIKILPSTATIYDIYGVSNDYMLAVGDFLQVFFNNGSGWQSITSLLNQNDSLFIFTNVWTDGYEIIIAGFGTYNGIQKTIIWHGK